MEEVNSKILDWLLWRQTAKLIRADAEKVNAAPALKLGGEYYAIVKNGFADRATEKERKELAAIRRAGTSILDAKEDQGETFVWWRQRGLSDLFRIKQVELNTEAQQRLEALLAEHISSYRS